MTDEQPARSFDSLRQPILVVLAIVSGVVVGTSSPEAGRALAPFGSLYLSLLLMCIIPLLFTAIVSSLGQMVAKHKLGRQLLMIFVVFALMNLSNSYQDEDRLEEALKLREQVRAALLAGAGEVNTEVTEAMKASQDYAEGRIKHIRLAVEAAIGSGPTGENGMLYIDRVVAQQEAAGAHYLDINVDEISIHLEEQRAAMEWLVGYVQGRTSLPVSP